MDDRQDWFRNRRKMLALLGVTGVNALSAHSSASSGGGGESARRTPACVVTPAQTEGPYFVDERLHRSDVRSDPSDGSVKEGLPLALEIRILNVGQTGCVPLQDAVVDIWQCDAQGVYSDVMDPAFQTRGKKFLRGYQMTDAKGIARFLTIYPGSYPGRTVHIHFKIRTKGKHRSAHEFTSQFYFDDTLTDRVHAQPPYTSAKSRLPRTRNEQDGIYRAGGDQLVLTLVETNQGYVATFDVGLKGIPA
ncbi:MULTISPECIES: intradiol ring-cleavage dioxygenase [unclassified Nitrosospira]|uniref:intradiol ring-cleavage dioxygenase n=1 Tax=unclassified Nitrosospira TaxID=2609267 RepID=UPI000D451ECA|nr:MULTISPECIES: intradiol ring-cleavage dioxygenase [unclassified Nitrosospira]PTR17077.1 dioxygenase-like protein [Nitrosospira sp. Nsp2]WON74574.1 intradiol ring-cleavage dioxygenase [Nitrosospira sp. Is2]